MLERVQNKYHIKKGILAAGILLLFCVTVGVGVWCLIVFVIQKLGDLFGQIDLFEEKFCIFVGNCCDGIEKKFGMDGAGIERFIMERVNVFIEKFPGSGSSQDYGRIGRICKEYRGDCGFPRNYDNRSGIAGKRL